MPDALSNATLPIYPGLGLARGTAGTDPHCLKLRDKLFCRIELRQWLGIDDIIKVV